MKYKYLANRGVSVSFDEHLVGGTIQRETYLAPTPGTKKLGLGSVAIPCLHVVPWALLACQCISVLQYISQVGHLPGPRYWPYAAYKHPGTLHTTMCTYIAYRICHLVLCIHVVIFEAQERTNVSGHFTKFPYIHETLILYSHRFACTNMCYD